MTGARGSGFSEGRLEDPPLLTGEAEYTDDIALPGIVYASFVRSQHGHARINEILTESASKSEGVLGIYTAFDIKRSDADNTLGFSKPEFTVGIDHPLLAHEHVRYHGQPVAVVLAESQYEANTAAARVAVDYERLDAITDPIAALEPNAPVIHDGRNDTNLAYSWDISENSGKYMDGAVTKTDVDAVLGSADHIVEVEEINNRVVACAMEPRAALARYRRMEDELSVVMTTQNPHLHQRWIGNTLNHPSHKIRVQARDVGGGFGSKNYQYPEETVVAWCAKQVDRPVKWVATRSEEFLTTYHGRDHVSSATVGLDEDGTLLGLKVRTYANLGAFDQGSHVPVNFAQMVPGQYQIPAVDIVVRGVLTNTSPTHAYRGAGRPEATYLIERVIHECARELEIDPVELRRKNFIPPEAFPFRTSTGLTYDSGRYEKTLRLAIDEVDYEGFKSHQPDVRSGGRVRGIGLSCYVEATGYGPGLYESCAIQVNPSGQIIAQVGTADHGQGHGTIYTQIIAEELGVSPDTIKVVDGDTDKVREGNGTYGSRSAPIGGSAVKQSSLKIKEKAQRFAAFELEVDESDLTYENGRFFVAGAPDRNLSFEEIAESLHTTRHRPEEMEPGLDTTTYFEPENYTYPFGTHAAVVEIDTETGDVEILEYVAVDDVGKRINPTLVEGQIHGGVAQGIGQALLEKTDHDTNGTLRTGSFLDYSVPRAMQIPEIRVHGTETPSPLNPLGAKGAGEAGTVAAPPAIMNAVHDALGSLGINADELQMPLDPESVLMAIENSNQ